MIFAAQSLPQLVEDAVAATSNVLTGREVSVRLPPGLPLVQADPAWIGKLLNNLLENAAKYSAPGSPVFISAEHGEGLVSCSVADRGAGIDPMEQSLIFDKFYRARNRRVNASGTGMGLAIARSIVEAHGGTISVTSQPGHGSVFTFTLPVASSNDLETAAIDSSQR
jgi:two-component system sensor histidine kinase KdpD